MGYKIEEIEGIGSSYAEKLNAAGIKTTEDLLSRCAKPYGRKKLYEETGISPKHIMTWTNHADLMRINGVGGQFAELLEAAGVDTVKELSHRNAVNLTTALESANDKRHLCGRVPSEREVQRMIDQAKEMPRMVEY